MPCQHPPPRGHLWSPGRPTDPLASATLGGEAIPNMAARSSARPSASALLHSCPKPTTPRGPSIKPAQNPVLSRLEVKEQGLGTVTA